MYSETDEITTRVTDEQIQFFADNGYLFVDRITSDEELAILREAYEEIFKHRSGRDTGNHLDLGGTDEDVDDITLEQILGPQQYNDAFLGTRAEKNARNIARQLIGEEATGGVKHAILKHPGGVETPWHQDEAYWDPINTYFSLSVWMPLQDCPIEMGCLQFIPESHKLPEIVPHQHINNDPSIHGLEVVPGQFDFSDAVSCPLKMGGVTFHRNNTLHYAGPNNTDEPRRALIFGFGVDQDRANEDREFPWQISSRTVSGRKRHDAQST